MNELPCNLSHLAMLQCAQVDLFAEAHAVKHQVLHCIVILDLAVLNLTRNKSNNNLNITIINQLQNVHIWIQKKPNSVQFSTCIGKKQKTKSILAKIRLRLTICSVLPRIFEFKKTRNRTKIKTHFLIGYNRTQTHRKTNKTYILTDIDKQI